MYPFSCVCGRNGWVTDKCMIIEDQNICGGVDFPSASSLLCCFLKGNDACASTIVWGGAWGWGEWHLVKLHLHKSQCFPACICIYYIGTYAHAIHRGGYKTVNASWKVKSQTAKVSCQGKCRNDTATCCLSQRTAPSSVAPMKGANAGSRFLLSPHMETLTPYLLI